MDLMATPAGKGCLAVKSWKGADNVTELSNVVSLEVK